jgi:hypothetical protein
MSEPVHFLKLPMEISSRAATSSRSMSEKLKRITARHRRSSEYTIVSLSDGGIIALQKKELEPK